MNLVAMGIVAMEKGAIDGIVMVLVVQLKFLLLLFLW